MGNCLGWQICILAFWVPVALVSFYDGTWTGVGRGLLAGLVLSVPMALMQWAATSDWD